ncbi:MAG TPA: GIY-YIG nuclease family protein [Gemmataceae bacterium]|nr:GIY-YIG nuclease family protein [Gemmataceae bacterium]
MNPSESTFWTYVLENPSGRFYVGHTDDLERRLVEHNDAESGDPTFTHKNGPWKLVWSEPHADRSAAMRREKQIKGMKSARWIRDHLLHGGVPTRRD